MIEIIGLITNKGKKTWTGIRVEAEFFDADGSFIDEQSTYIHSDISGNTEEHFKIQIRSRNASLLDENNKIVVKVSSARTSPF